MNDSEVTPAPPTSTVTPLLAWDADIYNAIALHEPVQFLQGLIGPGAQVFVQHIAEGSQDTYGWRTYTRKDGKLGMAPLYKITLPGGHTVGGSATNKGQIIRPAQLITGRIAMELKHSNMARAGVFACINELSNELTPGLKERSADRITRVRAVWVDLDATPLPETWPISPTVMIESSPGRYHVYWAADGVAVHEFKIIQRYLAQRYSGDLKVNDPCRLMRLPGYWHGKHEQRFLTRILELNEIRYARDELILAFEGLQDALEAARSRSASVSSGGPTPSRPAALPGNLNPQQIAYAQAALEAECLAVSNAQAGERNSQLFKSAAAVGSLVSTGALTRDLAGDLLRSAAVEAGLDDDEIQRTSERGLQAGEGTPRDLSRVGPRPKENVESRQPGLEDSENTLPTIIVTDRRLRDIAAESEKALIKANNPPVLFKRGGHLVKLVAGATPRAIRLSEEALKGELDRKADFMTSRTMKGEVREVPARPPIDLAPDLLARADDLNLPILSSISTLPVYTPDGRLLSTSGYDPQSGIYVALGAFQLPLLPNPREALRLLHELVVDFPFVSESGFAHFLCALLLLLVRPMIAGPTPLHLIDAVSQGTGKGLLASVIPLVVMGKPITAAVLPKSDRETEKRVSAYLMSGTPIILFDNCHHLAGEALAAVLTSRRWGGRILGKTETIEVTNDALWVATGNQVTVDKDLARRTLPIRLDAQSDRPADRTGFQHPDLPGWIAEYRGELVAAGLALVEAWIAAGRPSGRGTMGSYEKWVAIMGGILDVAGVPGLLGDREYLFGQTTRQDEDWVGLLKAVHAAHGSKPQRAGTFLEMMKARGTHADYWDNLESLRQSQLVGHALRNACERTYGKFRLSSAGISASTSTLLYRVEIVTVPVRGTTLDQPSGENLVQEGSAGVCGVPGVLAKNSNFRDVVEL